MRVVSAIIGTPAPGWCRMGFFDGHGQPITRIEMAPNDVTLPVRPWNLRGAFAVAAIPTIAYIPAVVFRLPDNGHEASLGFFVTLARLLFSWQVVATIGGVIPERRQRRVSAVRHQTARDSTVSMTQASGFRITVAPGPAHICRSFSSTRSA